jgi:hypothetical protein
LTSSLPTEPIRPGKRRRGGGTHGRRAKGLPIIGWREWLALPTLQVERIKAKIDTGARTSAIHAFNIRSFADRGSPHVSFVLHPEQRRRHPAIDCIAEVRDERMVTSSSGHAEKRYVIHVDVRLGAYLWPIELTLADRDPLGFRMLLGREAVRHRFLIDAGRSYLAARDRAARLTDTETRKPTA